MHGIPGIRPLAAATVLSVLFACGAPLIPALLGDGGTVQAHQSQTPEEALESDLRAIAKANGWTLEQARANHRSTVALDGVLETLQEEAPGTLVGSVLSQDPEAPPTIYIKGPSTPTIDALVAGADVPILIVDDQPWSFDENDERLTRVQQALLALDLGFVTASVDITARGRIEASVARTSGITDEEAAAIVASLPEDLRSDVQLTVIDPLIDAFLCGPQAEGPSASGSPSPSPSAPSPPSSSANATQTPCLDLPPGWGPLAVVDDPGIGGIDHGLGPGRLSIGARCVVLRGAHGSRWTLVWRAGDTRWDPDTRQILFVDRDRGLIRLSDGDRMTLGGFTPGTIASLDPDGFELRPWVTLPDDSCPGKLWEVNGVSPGPR